MLRVLCVVAEIPQCEARLVLTLCRSIHYCKNCSKAFENFKPVTRFTFFCLAVLNRVKFKFFLLAFATFPFALKAQYPLDTIIFKYSGNITTSTLERDNNYFYIFLKNNREDLKSKEFHEFLEIVKSLKGIVSLGNESINLYPNSFFWDSTICNKKERRYYMDFFQRSKWVEFMNHPVIYYRSNFRIPVDHEESRYAIHIPMSPVISVQLNPYDKIADTLISRVSGHTMGLWFQKRGFRIARKGQNFHYFIIPIRKIESDETKNFVKQLAKDPLVKSLWFEINYPIELDRFE